MNGRKDEPERESELERIRRLVREERLKRQTDESDASDASDASGEVKRKVRQRRLAGGRVTAPVVYLDERTMVAARARCAALNVSWSHYVSTLIGADIARLGADGDAGWPPRFLETW